MKRALLLIAIFLAAKANAILTVGIIDTGLRVGYTEHLCPNGFKDFSDTTMRDVSGHGTNIMGIISQAKGDYCIIILKYFDQERPGRTVSDEIAAIKYATARHINIINFSSNGLYYDKDEAAAIKQYISAGGIFVTAAGNNGFNLDVIDRSYPALADDRIVVVGNTGKRSNFGSRVNTIIDGNDITANGITMSGTSQSAAIYTKRLIERLLCLK